MSKSEPGTVESALAHLRADGQWEQAFGRARDTEESGPVEGWTDAALIEVYRECLGRGLTFQADPDNFLDACRRLSRLLFRYARFREANNYLLQLRDLSPASTAIPAWVWAYSAKLAYLEDIEYCIRKPQEVLDYIDRAVSENGPKVQLSAVLTDFVNQAAQHDSMRLEFALTKRFSSSIRTFLERWPTMCDARVVRALDKVDRRGGPERAIENVPTDEVNVIDLSQATNRREVEGLRARLQVVVDKAEILFRQNVELEKSNQELQHTIAQMRGEAEQHAISLSPLEGLGRRLEGQLQQLRLELEEEKEIGSELSATVRPGSDQVPQEAMSARSRILVIGESRVPNQKLVGICKRMGLAKNQVEYKLGYDAFNSFDIRSLEYNDSIAGILVGPVPHKVAGQDNPVEALLQGQGYPPTVRVETRSGELKITKSSFQEALDVLLTRLSSLEPAVS